MPQSPGIRFISAIPRIICSNSNCDAKCKKKNETDKDAQMQIFYKNCQG